MRHGASPGVLHLVRLPCLALTPSSSYSFSNAPGNPCMRLQWYLLRKRLLMAQGIKALFRSISGHWCRIKAEIISTNSPIEHCLIANFWWMTGKLSFSMRLEPTIMSQISCTMTLMGGVSEWNFFWEHQKEVQEWWGLKFVEWKLQVTHHVITNQSFNDDERKTDR